MKLTDIENPLVQDGSKPIYVMTERGRGKVVGYTPSMQITSVQEGDRYPFTQKQYWHILLDGDDPGYEVGICDAEIIDSP
jgi:hypothetical protein